jgi:hypothetical protein
MNLKSKIAVFAILIAALLRLIPHPPNVTPVGAMALIGGVYLGRKYLVFLIPILALFLSDMLLNNTIYRAYYTEETGFIFFQEYMITIYAAFALIVLLGVAIKKWRGAKLIIGGAFMASLLFFVISNFAVWLMGSQYPKNLSGLMACYAAAVPFFRNTLVGNLVYTAVFVMGIEAVYSYYLRTEKA